MYRRFFLLAGLAQLGLGDPAYLVKDIDARIGISGSSSSGFVQVGATVFYSSGRSLWRTDGTASGTILLREIGFNIAQGPTCLQALGAKLFFLGNEDSTGTQLWQSDGTPAGTKLVAETGGGTSITACPVNVNGSLFFTVSNGISFFAGLWKSDGTTAGTALVTNSVFPGPLTAVNSTLFFAASDSVHGYELWKSDGTAAGTVLVKDINLGAASSNPQNLTNVNGTLFLTASDPDHGPELWKSDGTAAGTVLVKDITPGAGGSFSQFSSVAKFTDVNGTLFFAVSDTIYGTELWKSDGTAAGTVLVKDINPGAGSSSPSSFLNFNGTLFFTAADPASGTELWKSDGTAAGTVLVKDINPGAASSVPFSLTNVNGALFFTLLTDPVAGSELWKSDGTAAGTVMVKDIVPGPANSSPSSLANVNGVLYFSTNALGGVWKSDGTAAGTVRVDAGVVVGFSSTPNNLTNVNGTLFFTATDPTNGTELWKSDGTAAGTVLVKDINPGAASSRPQDLTNVNGTLFFTASDLAHGAELWKSDGTTAGTVLVKDITPGAGGSFSQFSSVANFTNVNGTLFFAASDPAHGIELWKTDGTAAGTVLVKDINPGAGSSISISAFTLLNLTNINGTLFFVASEPAHGAELWKSDGTAAGTVLVKDINPGAGSSSPNNLVNVNGTLYFRAFEPATGGELWKSDGTAAGTVLVADIVPGPGTSAPSNNNITNVNGTVFFTASPALTGTELWKSDGTAAGTVLVKDINPGRTESSDPVILVNLHGKLLFFANDGLTGWELWVSDGSSAGTHLVKDINPGPTGSIAEPPAFYFPMLALTRSAVLGVSDGLTGIELWKSNGDGIGTFLVQDINPGPSSSFPGPQLSSGQFTQVANQVFFPANDGVHGRELWVIPLSALDVSLQEQMDKLILLLRDPSTLTPQKSTPVITLVETARDLISQGNGQGSLTAARAHLANVISDLQHLVGKGDIAPDKGKLILEGAQDVLEQIEGNHPVRPPFVVEPLSMPDQALADFPR